MSKCSVGVVSCCLFAPATADLNRNGMLVGRSES